MRLSTKFIALALVAVASATAVVPPGNNAVGTASHGQADTFLAHPAHASRAISEDNAPGDAPGPCVPGTYWCSAPRRRWIFVCTVDKVWKTAADCGKDNCCGYDSLQVAHCYCSLKDSAGSDHVIDGPSPSVVSSTPTPNHVPRALATANGSASASDPCKPGLYACNAPNLRYIIVCNVNGVWEWAADCQKDRYCWYDQTNVPHCYGSAGAGSNLAIDSSNRPAMSSLPGPSSLGTASPAFAIAKKRDDNADPPCPIGKFICSPNAQWIFVCGGEAKWHKSADCGTEGCCSYGANGLLFCQCKATSASAPYSLESRDGAGEPKPTNDHSNNPKHDPHDGPTDEKYIDIPPIDDAPCRSATYTCGQAHTNIYVCDSGAWQLFLECGRENCAVGSNGLPYCRSHSIAQGVSGRSFGPGKHQIQARDPDYDPFAPCRPGEYRCGEFKAFIDVCGTDGRFHRAADCWANGCCREPPSGIPYCACGVNPPESDVSPPPTAAAHAVHSGSATLITEALPSGARPGLSPTLKKKSDPGAVRVEPCDPKRGDVVKCDGSRIYACQRNESSKVYIWQFQEDCGGSTEDRCCRHARPTGTVVHCACGNSGSVTTQAS